MGVKKVGLRKKMGVKEKWGLKKCGGKNKTKWGKRGGRNIWIQI